MLQCTKEAYLREVECGTWEEAEEVLPEYSKEDRLSQYRIQRGKTLPQKFQVIMGFITHVLLVKMLFVLRYSAKRLKLQNSSILYQHQHQQQHRKCFSVNRMFVP